MRIGLIHQWRIRERGRSFPILVPMQGPEFAEFHGFHVTIVERYQGAAIVTIYANARHAAVIPAFPCGW